MTETILAAESGIQVGHHTEAHWFGLTVNTDTVLATAIAAVIVLGLAFFLRAKVTSTGVPGGVQLFWEAITTQTRTQIENAIGMKIAPFVLPLAVTLFVFILVANWISVLPGAVHRLQRSHPRTAQAAGIRHQLRAGARPVRIHLLPRRGVLAPRTSRPPVARC